MVETYLDVHLFLVLPPVALLVLVAGTRMGVRRRIEWAGIGLMVLLTRVYGALG